MIEDPIGEIREKLYFLEDVFSFSGISLVEAGDCVM